MAEQEGAASRVLNAFSTNIPSVPAKHSANPTRKRRCDDGITEEKGPNQDVPAKDASDLDIVGKSNEENPASNEIITPEMLAVEKKLIKQLEKDNIKRNKKIEALANIVTEEELASSRYKRLMHLLGRSSFYSSFMKQKLENLKNNPSKDVKRKKPHVRLAKPSNTPEEDTDDEALIPKKKKKKKVLKHTDNYDVAKILNDLEVVIVSSDEEDFDDEELPPDSPDKRSHRKGRPGHKDDTASQGEEEADGQPYVNAMGFTVAALQPPLFEGGVMRDYQLDGLEWLKVLDGNNVSGILGDEMGLGKTIQVISMISHLVGQKTAGPFLIIAPLSTIPNWMSEFERFAPQIPVLLVHGNSQTRQRRLREFKACRKVAGVSMHPVVITSFQIPMVETNFFRGRKWRYMVVDEGHRLKNHQSQLSMELKQYNTVNRLILTGTPLQNNLAELWSLLNFLLPEIFNDLASFETWLNCEDLLAKGGEDKVIAQEEERKILSTMHQILSPFLLRRTKADVSLDLPPKKELLVFCPLTITQKQLYSAVLDKSISALSRKQEELLQDPYENRPKRRCVLRRAGRSYADAAAAAADDKSDDDVENWPEIRQGVVEIVDKEDPTHKYHIRMQHPEMILRLIVNHPYQIQFPLMPGTRNLRIDEDLVTKSGKMMVLERMLEKLKQRDHKVLIFSGFVMMLDLIADFLDMREYEHCRLDGSSNLESRQSEIRRFNTDPSVFVFLLSTRAGGLGINLTAADTVITFDSDWNPQTDLQAQDRCHRIGQTRPVVVYRFTTKGTIDQVIVNRAAAKRKLEKMIIRPGAYKMNAKMSQAPNTKVDLVELRNLLSASDFQGEMHSEGSLYNDAQLDALLDRSEMLAEMEKNKAKRALESTQED